MSSGQLSSFNYAGQSQETLRIKNISANYTIQANDLGFVINCIGGTFTVSLAAAATLGAGFNVTVWNNAGPAFSSTSSITIDPNGVETIDGATTLILRCSEGTEIVCDGANFQTGDKKTMRGYAENMQLGNGKPTASGDLALALGFNASATGANSLAIGRSTLASGQYGLAIVQARAAGTNSFAAQILSDAGFYGAANTSAVAIGAFNYASASYASAIGGATNTASGEYSLCVGGNTNTASATYSAAFGFQANAAIYGKHAHASGFFASLGDAQTGTFVLRRSTTDATPTVLTTDNTTPGTDDQVILPNNSAFAFTGTIIARQQAAGGSNFAAWEIKGAILRGANAASTTIGSFNINALSATAGAAAWVVALSADTTNGGLAVTVTGAAATNIRWVATVQTSEVTYA
jgi:hypothetical protein